MAKKGVLSVKNRLLISLMITCVAVCSALFARYSTQNKEQAYDGEAVQIMSYVYDDEEEPSGITFSDLAKKVESLVNDRSKS